MKLAYLGNFGVDFSTETHVAKSLHSLGHDVLQIQEGETRAADVPEYVVAEGCEALLWTQTYGLAETGGTRDERVAMLEAIDVPTIGFHLDKWWGLGREDQLHAEPFFSVDYLFTADGGHQDEFADLGINHYWSPPAVFHEETGRGTYSARFGSEVAFVGNWRGGYHEEAWHRHALIQHLRTRWKKSCRLWPRNHAIRGADLQRLYASARVVVGDSCLLPGTTRYWSDRIPETLGRGGFLLHPYVEGIEEHFTDGKHLRLWEMGDWAELDRLIAYYLDHENERRQIADAGMAHVQEHHTYRNRMQTVLDTVFAEVAA